MANNDFTMELLCCEFTILNEIQQKECKRKDIALTYYLCMVSSENIDSENIDWKKVNEAIINRWSFSGLEYIKNEAWKWHEKKIRQRELQALLNNCVDDDEAILYQRELEGLEEGNRCRIFKCKICEREFYVPHNIYTVNCPCGATGYSEELVKEKEEVNTNG